MPTIRPFESTDADYARISAVVAAIWPEDGFAVEYFQHEDEIRSPDYLFERVVVDEAGEIPAFAQVMEKARAYVPGHYELWIVVHPDRRREGLGTRLYRWCLERIAHRVPAPVRLGTETREDQVGALAMLEKHGFEQVMRSPHSALDVAAFDPAPFGPVARRVRDSGIEIVTLADLMARDPDWEQKFYELSWAVLRDIPSPTPRTRPPFEHWRRRLLDSPGFLPDGHFIARDGGARLVGTTGLWAALGKRTLLYQGITGVIGSHRRRGIATALKLRAIEFARTYGAETVRTNNEENNPMYRINLSLGFEPRPARLHFERAW